MIHIVERTLKVKGLKTPKNIVAITDLHLTFCDERDSDEYSQKLHSERSYMFPNGDRCFAEIREYVRKTQPDAVMACGDIIDFPSAANLDAIDEFFNKECKNYVYALGNHDWNYPKTYNSIYNWLDNVPKFKVIKNGNPYVQVTDLGDVLLVAIDNQADRVFPETVKQFKEVLKLQKPLLVCMHVPPYCPPIAEEILSDDRHKDLLLMMGVPKEYEHLLKHYKSCLANEATTEILEIFKDPNVPIIATLSGHVHFESKPNDFLAETEYAPGKMQYGLRLSAPQRTNEAVLLLLHLIPNE